MSSLRLLIPFFLVGWFGAHGEVLMREALGHDCSEITPEHCAALRTKELRELERASRTATVATALLSALVGWRLGRRRRGNWGAAAVALPLIAGGFNGGLLAAWVLHDPRAAAVGALLGVVYAMLYVGPSWLLCFAYFESRDRWALWQATQLTLLFTAGFDCLPDVVTIPSAGPRAAIAVAGAIGVSVLVLHLRARRALLRRHAAQTALALGPYREAPAAPVDARSHQMLDRAIALDGLLLAACAALWVGSRWLSSLR